MELDKEDAGQFLQRVGMDGKLWAEEMHKRFPQIAEDDLLGWCCNMIMAGYDEAERRAKAAYLAARPSVADGDLEKVARAMAVSVYHSEGLETLVPSKTAEDYANHAWQDYKSLAKAALSAITQTEVKEK